MELKGHTLDDILIDLYEALLATEGRNEGGSRGPSREILGVTLHIADPRSRLSRSEDRGKPFSALGELIWYLSGSNSLEFIEPYIPRYKDDAVEGALPGAYGPRMLAKNGSINQIENVTSLLRERPGSRRAVIQLFDAEDIAVHKSEIPCTTTIQFHLRGAVLHMSVTMRSNDAYLGLPHDVFCFTMIQEMMARRLNAELGTYIHHAGLSHPLIFRRNQRENFLCRIASLHRLRRLRDCHSIAVESGLLAKFKAQVARKRFQMHS